MKGGYSPEQAGRIAAEWSFTHEQLAKSLNYVDQAIDIDSAVRPMNEPLLSRRLGRLIRDAHRPAINPQTGKFPDVAILREEVTRLRAEGMAKEAHLLGRTIRDILLLTALSSRMSKSQAPTREDCRSTTDISCRPMVKPNQPAL